MQYTAYQNHEILSFYVKYHDGFDSPFKATNACPIKGKNQEGHIRYENGPPV